jgi:RecA-family ATPase
MNGLGAPDVVPLEEAERAAAPPQRSSRNVRPFQPIEAVQLHDLPLPNRPWLVDGWIPDRAVTLLGGDGGTGKSLLSLQLIIAAALGKPWLGLPVPQRRSLALFCEDDKDEVHLRAAAIAKHYAVQLGDVEHAFWDPRSGEENVLMSFRERDNTGKVSILFDQVRYFVRENGVQLLIVDTLADCFSGNENVRSQARAFVNLLCGVAIEMDGAVILTAHPSVDGQRSGSGLSGSTAWNNSVRSRLYLTRPTGDNVDPNERVLQRVKSNYGTIGDQIRIRWTDDVLEAIDAPGSLDRMAMAARADRVFGELLRITYETGVWVSPSPTSNNYAPTLFAKRPDGEGLGKKALEAAMYRLMSSGAIRTEQYGRPSEPRTRLVLA